jgi:hypothetical protein
MQRKSWNTRQQEGLAMSSDGPTRKVLKKYYDDIAAKKVKWVVDGGFVTVKLGKITMTKASIAILGVQVRV